MKKIFTLVFSVGLVASAFAQNGQRHQNGQNNSNGYQQPQYQATQKVNQNGYSQTNGRYDEHNTVQFKQPIQPRYAYDRDRDFMAQQMREKQLREMKEREMMMERQRYASRYQKRFDNRYDQRRDRRDW